MENRHWSDMAMLVLRQNEVIRKESDIIDDLFLLLIQYISVEEAEKLPVFDKIDQAAKLRNEIAL